MPGVLELLIRARDEASRVVEDVEQKVSSVTQRLERNWVKVGIASAAFGTSLEAVARNVAPLNEQTSKLAASLELTEGEVRELALSLSNVTLPLKDTLELMVKGREQGLKSAEALEEYVKFWDMVGDATGEAATYLAEASVALRAVGITAGNEKEALAAFGYITRESSGNVSEFLQFLQLTGPELRELGLDVNQTAAIMGILEHEFGMTARVARTEFRQAVRESAGSLDKLLRTLGVGPEIFAQYTAKVAESSGVIAENAEIHGRSYTVLQQVQHWISEVVYANGELIQAISTLTPLLFALGPIIKGVTLALHGLAAAKTALLGPLGLLIGAGAGLALLITYLTNLGDKAEEVQGSISEFGAKLGTVRTAVDVLRRDLAETNAALDTMKTNLERAGNAASDARSKVEAQIKVLQDLIAETDVATMSTEKLREQFALISEGLIQLDADIEAAIKAEAQLAQEIEASSNLVTATRAKQVEAFQVWQMAAGLAYEAIGRLAQAEAEYAAQSRELEEAWIAGRIVTSEYISRLWDLGIALDAVRKESADATMIMEGAAQVYDDLGVAVQEAETTLADWKEKAAAAAQKTEELLTAAGLTRAEYERLRTELVEQVRALEQQAKGLGGARSTLMDWLKTWQMAFADLSHLRQRDEEEAVQWALRVRDQLQAHAAAVDTVYQALHSTALGLVADYQRMVEANEAALAKKIDAEQRAATRETELHEEAKKRLQEGKISYEEYVRAIKDATAERIEAERQAAEEYEKTHKTIGDLLRDATIRVLRALQQELIAEAAARLAIATMRALLGDLTAVGAALQIGGIAGVGAVAIEGAISVVSGLQHGGIATQPAYRLIGEGPYDEAVIPLSPWVFEQMATAIVQRLPREGGTYAPTINFYSPRPLTVAEARRQTERTLRQQALVWEGR